MAKYFSSRQSGFSLIELMVVVGIAGVVVAGGSAAFVGLMKHQQRVNFLVALSTLRLDLQQPVIRTADWTYTMSKNSGMSCFSGGTPTSCLALASVGPQDLALYAAAQTTPIYDGHRLTAGFTREGAPCNTYGSPGDCVLRPNLKWQVQCNTVDDPQCLSPLVIVTLNYTYAGPELGPIDFSSYGYRIAVATFPLQAVEACPGPVTVGCTSSQAAICESGVWNCEEFGP